MSKPFIKITALLLIIGLNWFGLSAIGETLAYFNDTENSQNNILSAAWLDFSITNTDIEEFIGVELGEDIEFISVVTKTTGSLDIQYKAKAEKISGSDDFCNALQLEAFHSVISYDGALLSFDTATTTALGTWAFEIKLPHTATHIPHGEECNVDLVFEGWREDVADFDQSGFTDEERIHLNLTSRMIVLNEFLPRPDGVAYGFDFGNDSSNMPQGEWVELYNNGNTAVDVTGWYLRDSTPGEGNKTPINTDHILTASPTVPAHGWLVVYMNKPIYDNTGDTVRLFDSSDMLVDSYSYSTDPDYCDIEPTPGDENTTDTFGSCAGVPPNKSYARIPDGIGGWVDPIPTPGAPNLLESEIIDQAENEDWSPDESQETAEEAPTFVGTPEENETEGSADESQGEEELDDSREAVPEDIREDVNESPDDTLSGVVQDNESGVVQEEQVEIEELGEEESSNQELVLEESEESMAEESLFDDSIKEAPVNEPILESEPEENLTGSESESGTVPLEDGTPLEESQEIDAGQDAQQPQEESGSPDESQDEEELDDSREAVIDRDEEDTLSGVVQDVIQEQEDIINLEESQNEDEEDNQDENN